MSSQGEEIIEEYVEEVVVFEDKIVEKKAEEKAVEEKIEEKIVEENVTEEKVSEGKIFEEKVVEKKESNEKESNGDEEKVVAEEIIQKKSAEEKATVEEKSDTSGETTVDQLLKPSVPKQEIDYSLVDEPPAKLKEEERKYVETDAKPKISFIDLYRFASPLDCLLIFLGTLGATANGTGLPLMTIVFAGILQALIDYQAKITNEHDLSEAVRKNVILFLILGASIFVVSYLQMTCWMTAGENITGRLRQKYFSAVLRQDIAYFDSTITTGDVTSRISSDISIFQEGISEKVGLSIQFIVTFITGFIIGYIKGWRLALVLTSVIPLLAIGAAGLGKALQSSTAKSQDAYAEAGSVAEQTISGIKTIASFGGQNNAIERYTEKLEMAYRTGKKKAIISGIGLGCIFFIMFSAYGLAFWYGSKLVLKKEQTIGQVLNTFFALIIGAFSIGQAAPGFSAITNGMGAATTLYAVIDRVPSIDSSSPNGKKLVKSALKGRIEFKNVNFHYASRPDVPVLKNFSLIVEPGQTVALVGSSGSGKSTVVSLLERFYDPVDGSVCLDGEDLRNINIQSLRSRIGLVSQEPVLFPTTIRKNIKWGSTPGEKKPTMEEIIAACKKSNAHDFVEDLPKKYETLVGEGGALLSGGQKQRIAIARALIKDPTILLLDEATSALDADTERIVQQALDAAAAGRTTIVVAHRISTIKDADKIVVMYKGEIVEVGSHDELIAKQGRYYRLVKDQELQTHKKDKTELEEEEESESSTAGDISVTIEEKPAVIRRMSTKGSLFRTKTDEEIIAEEAERKKKLKTPFRRIAQVNKPELVYIILGVIGAMFQGAQMPLYAVIFTHVLKAFAQTDENKFKHDTSFWAGMFVVLASVCLIGCSLQIGFFSLSGERLTKRLRQMAFVAIIRQEMAFFDEEKHGTGILTSKLAVDATEVQGLAGSLMGTIIQSITTITIGLGLAFGYGWKLTLVVIAAMPIAGLASSLQLKTLAGFGARTRAAYEDSGQIVQQAVSNIRTIASLTRENTFKSAYTKALEEPHKTAIRGFALSAIGFGVAQGFLFFIWSLAFWYGTKLVVSGEYTVFNMMNVLFAVIFSAIGLGQISNFAPNVAKAKLAAISIFELVDRKSAIDPTDNEGKDRPAPVTGDAKIEKAHFRYPARPDVEVLGGLDMSALAGKTVALCGSSGSGKSTVVSLLLRFYDVNSGKVSVENVDIKDWSVEYLRSHMALVGQEPVLFDLSIGENIALAKPECTQEEIEASAKSANIHRFIETLPDKYNTRVGEKGAQLSGGQKQRVAIARALIRNPKLLLLDEATSALDGEAEKVVQAALDYASQNRTTVTIAHRLSTIQNADLILVVKDGVVVERGKHLDLISKGGIYAKLVSKQLLLSKTNKEIVIVDN